MIDESPAVDRRGAADAVGARGRGGALARAQHAVLDMGLDPQIFEGTERFVVGAGEGERVENYVTLKGGGREVEIGAFLSPEERLVLHDELEAQLRRFA